MANNKPVAVKLKDWIAHQTLRIKTEMIFETSVSTKTEPHHPADSPKELHH
jgi:hypothetical protein